MIVYFDDIMLATETIEEHLSLHSRVLNVMRDGQVEIQVIYLDYYVNQFGIQSNPKNISVIEHYPIPKNSKDLHSFIELAPDFRRFIPDFALFAKPL